MALRRREWPIEVSVFEDHAWAICLQFQQTRSDCRLPGVDDQLADLRGARESDLVHVHVTAREAPAVFSVSGNDVDHAFGNPLRG